MGGEGVRLGGARALMGSPTHIPAHLPTHLPLAVVLWVGDADPRVEAHEHVHARTGRAQRLQRHRLVHEERVARHATAGAARLVVGGEELHHLHALHEAGAHDRLVGILLGEQQQRPARPVHVGGWGDGLRQW